MEPASKVSVPLTVVMRTRSRVADKDLAPPDKSSAVAVFPVAAEPLKDHVLVVVSRQLIMKDPAIASVAVTLLIINPDVACILLNAPEVLKYALLAE